MRFPHINLEQLLSLRERQEALGLSDEAKERLQWLIHFAEHGRSVSETSRQFGIARTTLHRWIARFDAARPQSLEERRDAYHMHVSQPTASTHSTVHYVPQFIVQPTPAPEAMHVAPAHATSPRYSIEKILLIATLVALGWMIGVTQQTMELVSLSKAARDMIVETKNLQMLIQEVPSTHGAAPSSQSLHPDEQ